jgi:hypothetical protein
MTKMAAKRTGWSDFLSFLSEFKKLSAATVGAAAVPFVAALSGIAPPSPPGVTPITGLVQLVVLILVFQFLRWRSRAVVNRVLLLAMLMLFIFSTIYLMLFFYFTFDTPSPNPRGVRGFICKPDVTVAEKRECPFISRSLSAGTGYDPELLWESWTITTIQFALASTWFLNFITLSIVIGAFIVYQIKPRRRVNEASRSKT